MSGTVDVEATLVGADMGAVTKPNINALVANFLTDTSSAEDDGPHHPDGREGRLPRSVFVTRVKEITSRRDTPTNLSLK